MKIPSITITPLQNLITPSSAPLEDLKTGQEIYAKIIENIPSKNEVIIQLGNNLVRASSNASSIVGQTVLVQVEKTKTEVILNVKQNNNLSDFINPVLRQILPKQLPIHDFISPLKTLNRNINTSYNNALSTNSSIKYLNTLSNQILQATPTNRTLSTADGIKNAIKSSGVFLERNVIQSIIKQIPEINASTLNSINTKTGPVFTTANNQSLLSNNIKNDLANITSIDLKANLVKLINILKSWPGITPQNTSLIKNTKNEATQLTKAIQQKNNLATQKLNMQVQNLLTKTEGAVAKIMINQLVNSSPDTTSRQALQLEIPFYNGQTENALFIKIQQENNAHTKKQINNVWTVSLEMSPPNLGRIKNKLTLQGEQISSSFWAENNATGDLLKGHLNILHERFRLSKLTPKSLDVQTTIEPDLEKNTVLTSSFSEKV